MINSLDLGFMYIHMDIKCFRIVSEIKEITQETKESHRMEGAGMSLRFYFGASDGALGRKAYKDVIQRSLEQPDQNFLILVPDQFTMQTQKELALLHPRGGILNIDVLSFGRLSHRILEEVGNREIPVLDDTGKSLVLQKVTEGMGEKLPVLGGFLHKQGYIHEVKSAISEFMQYGLAPKDVEELVSYAGEKRVLAGKLRDLGVIYESFEEYIRDHFVTAEESLDILRRSLSRSKLLKGSVVLLDGFTGFTPIQYRLLQELAGSCSEMIITLVCGEEESPYRLDGEQKLFYLTKKTVTDLERLAAEADISRDRREDVFLRGEAQAGELAFLRDHLFRYDRQVFLEREGMQEEIRVFEATSPAQEVHQTALEMQRLLREQGIAYRDMVLITGDLEGYAPYVESELGRAGIPFFLDRTRGITLNPLTEFMMSALELTLENYSYEAVFHYLRSGMTGIPMAEIDRLENYVLAMGIRGKKAYQNRFVKRTKNMDPKDESELEGLNATREAFMTQVELLASKKTDKACNHVERLYDFLVGMNCQRKLAERAGAFAKRGEEARAKEYEQIYRLVLELLEQIHGLLGEEKINLQEFADILSAGLGEIQVGTIPQNVDRVLVGDMERTRFKPVKVLFFLGVNDGIIPRHVSKGGIISDMEREFLKDSGHELAPTPRQQMFIQRFYLYLNFTKPTERLYLSYSRQGSDGKALRPAYLIDSLKKSFPGLQVSRPQNMPALEQVLCETQGRELLSEDLRDYAAGLLPKEREKELFALYRAYGAAGRVQIRQRYEGAAFTRYEDVPLAKEISSMLYGTSLENSVSRLETFAACAYRHFLEYGLALKEREEFGFEAVDLGTVYHHVLEDFSNKLEEAGQTWFSFDEDFARKTVSESLEREAAGYGGSVLFSSQRNAYQVKRMERVLLRTVLTLQKQLQRGVFRPKDYEVQFHQIRELGDLRVSLGREEKLRLQGRIDRLDTCEDEEHIYVKVMDYKSGDKKFDLVALYYGLQLQLVVYMNAALEREKKVARDKEVVPAALLYYHVEDPLVESDRELTDEELDEEIMKSLRARGIVNGAPEVVRLLDSTFTDKSDVIPVERKKDGGYTARSGVMSREEIDLVSDFVNSKVNELGRRILNGDISLKPYERGKESACTYCPYGKVCGFDPSMPGCDPRTLEEYSPEEIMEKLRSEENSGEEPGEESREG